MVPHLGPETNIVGFRFWLNLKSQNKTDLRFKLRVKVSVDGDIWILVSHMGPRTNILGFRIMGFMDFIILLPLQIYRVGLHYI